MAFVQSPICNNASLGHHIFVQSPIATEPNLLHRAHSIPPTIVLNKYSHRCKGRHSSLVSKF